MSHQRGVQNTAGEWQAESEIQQLTSILVTDNLQFPVHDGSCTDHRFPQLLTSFHTFFVFRCTHFITGPTYISLNTGIYVSI